MKNEKKSLFYEEKSLVGLTPALAVQYCNYCSQPVDRQNDLIYI